MNRRRQWLWALGLAGVVATPAAAQPEQAQPEATTAPAEAVTPPPEAAAAPEVAPAPPAPAPYSPPWFLRPAVPLNVLLTDNVVGVYSNANGGGSSGVSFLLGSYKLFPTLAVMARVGLVGNSAPPPSAGAAAPGAGFSVVNPVLGLLWGVKVHPDLKLMLAFLGALPAGMGGGNDPNPGDPTDRAQKAFLASKAAAASGVMARSAMDNAMFAVNDAVLAPGVDLAWVKHGLTLQLEATLLFLMRARGELVQADTFKLNLTTGLHAGYFIAKWFSVGADLHYQRWIVPPRAIATATSAAVWAGMSQTSMSLGPRFHFKVGSVWLRPGLSYSTGFDAPMTAASYHAFQLHLPIVF